MSVTTKAVHVKPDVDTGYRAVCPDCACRYDESERMIGKERYLTFEPCPPCSKRSGVQRRLKAESAQQRLLYGKKYKP